MSNDICCVCGKPGATVQVYNQRHLDCDATPAAGPWRYDLSECPRGRALFLYKDMRSYTGQFDGIDFICDLTTKPSSPIAWAAINIPEAE